MIATPLIFQLYFPIQLHRAHGLQSRGEKGPAKSGRPGPKFWAEKFPAGPAQGRAGPAQGRPSFEMCEVKKFFWIMWSDKNF